MDNAVVDIGLNMTGSSPDVEHLHRLARDRSRQGRSALVAAIGDLYADSEQVLTSIDRQMMTDIILRLLNGIEISVREALANLFADRADAPHQLVLALAGDEIGVAYPLLARSEVLRDADLIEFVQQRTMEHQLAIAARRFIREPVSDALVATENPTVIVRLLENPGSRIAIVTMSQLVDKSQNTPAYQGPLVARDDLPPALMRKLYWSVSAALRQHLVQRHQFDPTVLDDAVEAVVRGLLGEESAAMQHRPARTNGINDPGALLLSFLRAGDVESFMARLAELTGLRPTLLRRFIFEPGGETFAVCGRAIGIGKGDFLYLFILCRQGRIGDKQIDEDEIRKVTVLFDKIEMTSAQAMLRYWQRSPEYLAALRLTSSS